MNINSSNPLSANRSEVGQVFALSWLITWYGHVLKDFGTIVRLYDFFLATDPLMPLYFGAAVNIVFPSFFLVSRFQQLDSFYLTTVGNYL